MSQTISRLAAVTVLLLLVGCASSDWIESTLVTVDVTGIWDGNWVSGSGQSGTLQLTLKQAGSKVTGDLMSTGGSRLAWGGASLTKRNDDHLDLTQHPRR